MRPVCFHIGALPIHWYGVMMAIGFLAGLATWCFLGKREGRTFNFCSDLLFWIMIAGIIGARIAYVIANYEDFRDEPFSIIRIDQGGLVYYGGFIAAGLGVLIFARARGEHIGRLVDFVVTALPIGHAFGRVGCFLNGCCFGRTWTGVPAVRYPLSSAAGLAHLRAGLLANERVRFLVEQYAGWRITRAELAAKLSDLVASGAASKGETLSLPVHPVQLYEAAFNVCVYLVLLWAYPRRKRDGRITALYLLLYPAGRFALEFLRGDVRIRWFGLSVSQNVSIALFILGFAILLKTRTQDP